MTRGTTLLMTALLVLAAGGCTRSEPAPAAPEGFVRYEGDGYSFAHPDGWEVKTGDAMSEPEREVEVYGPETDDGFRIAIAVERSQGLPEDVDMDGFVSMFNVNADAQLAGREVVSEDSAQVEGARDARRVEVTYRATFSGEEVEGRQIDLLVLGADGLALDVRVASRADDFDADLADAVLSSVVLTES